MKIVIVLLIFLFFNFNFQKVYSRVSSSENCLSCKSEGEICYMKPEDEGAKISDCRDDLVCGTDSSNLGSNIMICQKPSTNGCVDSTVCDIGLLCDYEAQYCADVQFAGIGESCKKNSDCSKKENVEITCENGYCKSNKTNCDTPTDCGNGEACNKDGKCVPQVPIGGQCNDDFDCGILSFCSKDTKTCTIYKSIGEGGKCTSEEIDCLSGYQCVDSLRNGNKICTQGQLVSSSEDKQSNCSLSNNCELDSFCDCQSGLCKKYPKDPSKVYLDRVECLLKNKCPLVNNLYSKSSCFTKYCKQSEIENQMDNYCKNTIFEINYQNIDQQVTGDSVSALIHLNALLLSTTLLFIFLINVKL